MAYQSKHGVDDVGFFFSTKQKNFYCLAFSTKPNIFKFISPSTLIKKKKKGCSNPKEIPQQILLWCGSPVDVSLSKIWKVGQEIFHSSAKKKQNQLDALLNLHCSLKMDHTKYLFHDVNFSEFFFFCTCVFQVSSDGQTVTPNQYGWNQKANLLVNLIHFAQTILTSHPKTKSNSTSTTQLELVSLMLPTHMAINTLRKVLPPSFGSSCKTSTNCTHNMPTCLSTSLEKAMVDVRIRMHISWKQHYKKKKIRLRSCLRCLCCSTKRRQEGNEHSIERNCCWKWMGRSFDSSWKLCSLCMYDIFFFFPPFITFF